MTKKGWLWYLALGMFYLGLCVLGYTYYLQVQHIANYRVDPEIDGEFEGNDWVSWINTTQGVIADQVHPLPGYKPSSHPKIRKGDRVKEIQYNPITQAEVADRITASSRPGQAFQWKFETTDPLSQTKDEKLGFIINGFRIPFGFNHFAGYWHLSGWIVGIGAFVSLVMLTILLPIVRGNWRDFLPLMGIVGSAFAFFLLQLFHHIYLIVESDLEHVGPEKIFMLGYAGLLFLYVLYYFYYKSGVKSVLFMIPSVSLGIFFMVQFFQIIFIDKQLRFFHDMVEMYTGLFFLVHLLGAVLLHISTYEGGRPVQGLLGLIAIATCSAGGIWFLAGYGDYSAGEREHVMFFYNLLVFFPLFNATFLQLQFGKVSLVVTQTIQYLVTFVVSIILFLLISQLFDMIRPNIQYRRFLEFTTFLIALGMIRLIYQANENRFSKYFVSSQRERMSKFKGFIARIPQYTSADSLRKDLLSQMQDFFNSEEVIFWWNVDMPSTQEEEHFHQRQESIYRQLTDHHTVWSRTKELSPFRLTHGLEKMVLSSPYTLICPVTIDQDNYALLMLCKKRRGVYNLTDLELISQLIQQTQLTLNVLQLVDREKELIQQTYEANLTALRSQINPHFLFNTLNSIGELVHESAELAEEAVEKLAFIFRYTLKKSSENFVALGDEMSLITTYLELEKIRFGERLDTHIEVAPDVRDISIPAFILQTLVENCIKHGIAKILHKGLVSVVAFREEGFLVCEVVDNGPGIDLSRIFKSTGLSNSIARLENIYERKNLLHFENTGDGTYVRLKIPLVEHPQLS
ncbi:histidine kinase [Pontibacter sp. G13]|uniref:sensor histidine kinase n=1 Tax=Pontibacter sp. G13 TaxID=3074898 RepID=UPI0028895C90|nr:histidine kinase [Pontibacter sp. G13]WNJ16265.1 histidine kinase [Pontibacter sp. G13]